MKTLKIILLALAFIALQAHAKDGRNLVVKQNASTGKRIALVIGNGNYQHTDILKKLPNPPHDAEDIAKALRGFGFEVIEKKDQSQESMREAIAEFSRKITDSDAALFYYAGHGLQVKGKNYLVPVDAKIETEAQAGARSIDVSEILEEMDNAKSKVNIVMLDACRSNDFSGKFRSGATRGLAAPASQPKGTVIVYATDPGNVAADGAGRNGLFTAGLLAAFKGGDLSLRGVLVRASKEVEFGSGNTQTPYINGPATLQEDFRFAPSQGTQIASLVSVSAPAQPAAQAKSKEQIEDEYWDVIKDSNDPSGLEQYRKAYPKGRYLNTANLKIAQFKKQAQEPVPVAPPPTRADGENDLWTEAQKGNSKDGYEAYLTQYPKGKHIALAKSSIKKLQDEAANETSRREQDAWEIAGKSESEEGYQSFLNGWPAGQYAGLAQVRIKKLQTDLAAQPETDSQLYARLEPDRQRQKAEAEQAKQKQAEAQAREKQEAESPRQQIGRLEKGYISQGGLTWMPVTFEKTWAEANSYCANTTIRGQSGWRLPTKDELEALHVQISRSSSTLSDLRWKMNGTWSTTPNGIEGGHYYVFLLGGYVGSTLGETKSEMYVSCVRSDPFVKPASEAAAKGAAYVSQGGLTWMPVTFLKNWSEANSYCATTTIRGQTGWRLPTKDELSALDASGAMNDQGWLLFNTWSSTLKSSGGHYHVVLSNGFVTEFPDTYSLGMTCVH